MEETRQRFVYSDIYIIKKLTKQFFSYVHIIVDPTMKFSFLIRNLKFRVTKKTKEVSLIFFNSFFQNKVTTQFIVNFSCSKIKL